MCRAAVRASASALLLGCCAVMWGGGCAINPVTRRPEIVLITAEGEKQLGQEEAQRIEAGLGFVDNAALQGYVDAIGQRLAQRSPRQDITYSFHIVESSEPNAFALPGGYVYVTRGLLALANSEDELAVIMGHEIGHVAGRHAVQQISRATPFDVLTGLTAGVTGLVSPLLGDLVGGLGGLATGLVLAPYSRDQEREADRVGQEMAAQDGWDPAAIEGFLTALQRQEELKGDAPRRPGFLDAHPATPERIANTRAYAATLPRSVVAPIAASRAEFLQRLDGLVVGPRASQGLFEGQRFLHPSLDFSVQFPLDWRCANSRQQIVAADPNAAAIILLQMVAPGSDPLDGARRLQQESKAQIVPQTHRMTIGDLPAARALVQARGDRGDVVVHLTWIAHARTIYQLTGFTSVEGSTAYLPVFDVVAKSFRPLSPAERAGIHEARLRLVSADNGEMLDHLVARTGTLWSPDMVAVANGLDVNMPLRGGQLIKVAVSEPYVTLDAP